jgi:hypothetical protein
VENALLFSGTFAELPKATIKYVMCSSASKNSASTGQIFMKFGIRLFLENPSKNQISSKSDNNNGYFT